MSAEDKSPHTAVSPVSPKNNAAAMPPQSVQRRRWAPPPPSSMSRFSIVMVLCVATGLAIALVFTLHYVLVTSNDTSTRKVALGPEFKDIAEMADFAFRAPRNWQIDDRVQKYTYYVKGPSEKDFFPLMIFTSVASPGGLQTFIDEHKKRLRILEPTVKIISEEDDSIDGCRTKRLEYDCDFKETDTSPVVHLRTLQFIIKDPSFPEYFKITCHAKAETYASHVAEFEASAHSFRRVEVKATVPKFLPPEK